MVVLPVVLLIAFSSDSRDGTQQEPKVLPIKNPEKIPGLDLTKIPFEDIAARVNDLTLKNSRVVVDQDTAKKVDIVVQKTEKDSELQEEKSKKVKGPIPLYSLVKNDCEKGYIMDQNGICQKAVVMRTGEKDFDSERKRRRKRHIQDGELFGHKNLKPFYESFGKLFQYRKLLDKLMGNDPIKCEKIFPDLVSDEAGGCKRSIPRQDVGHFRFFHTQARRRSSSVNT